MQLLLLIAGWIAALCGWGAWWYEVSQLRDMVQAQRESDERFLRGIQAEQQAKRWDAGRSK